MFVCQLLQSPLCAGISYMLSKVSNVIYDKKRKSRNVNVVKLVVLLEWISFRLTSL